MDNQNSFPDLCELSAKYHESDEDASIRNCMVDLRIASGEVPLGDHECLIEFMRLFISADHEGMEVVSGSLYGDPKRSNEVSLLNDVHKTKEDKGCISGSLELLPKSIRPKLKLAQETNQVTSQEVRLKDEGTDLRVKARPNLRWEVREPTGVPLDATFLAGDRLLALTKRDGGNRNYSFLELKVKQRDLRISPARGHAKTEKRFSDLTTTKRRILDIFIAKSLSSASYSKQEYRGEILVSRCEFNHEE
jgi:hypothetical protein